MPQARKNQAEQAEQKETQAQKREREKRERAEASAVGYEPREGGPFDAARGYVGAQFDIALEVAERYAAIVAERKEVRDVLKSLHAQRLLTPDEVVVYFQMFPERTASDDESANGAEPAAETAPAAA